MTEKPQLAQGIITNANADLQVHQFSFLGRNTIENSLRSMERNKLDIIAQGELNRDGFPELFRQASQVPYDLADNTGFKFVNGNPARPKYVLRLTEYDTREGFQVMVIGHHVEATPETEMEEIIEKGLEAKALVGIDNPFADNLITKTAGHISESQEELLGEICRKYNGEIFLEWNGYSKPWIRRGLQIGLNLFGRNIRYHDINKPVEELSSRLFQESVNIPVVADSDTHGRNPRYLSNMGRARIILDYVEGDSPREILGSMKEQIFAGDNNYRNVKNYASTPHILGAYCVPLITKRLRPRS